jgi:hypothetical protein
VTTLACLGALLVSASSQTPFTGIQADRNRKKSPLGTLMSDPTSRTSLRSGFGRPGMVIWEQCASCHGVFGEQSNFLRWWAGPRRKISSGNVQRLERPRVSGATTLMRRPTCLPCGITSTAPCHGPRLMR